MLVGADKLSKETRRSLDEFVEDLEARVKIQITRDGGDHLWGMKLDYIDDEGKTVAEETYMTARGNSGYIAQFVVFYQDDGQHVDFSAWCPMPIFTDDEEGKPKTLSTFVLIVLEQLTPHPLTAELLGIEDACSLDGEEDEEDEEVDEEDESEP